MRILQVCLTFDRNYLPFALVLLRSISNRLTSGYVVHVTILTACPYLLRSPVAKLHSFENISVKIVDVSADLQKYQTRADRFPPEAFARFFIGRYLNGRVLYLDVDMIALRCISEIFDVDLNGFSFGAVIDNGHQVEKLMGRYPRYPHKYFNAGLLLIDLDSGKAEEAFAEAISSSRLVYYRLADQDALNFVLRGGFYPLPSDFNFTTVFAGREAILYHFAHVKPCSQMRFLPAYKQFFDLCSDLEIEAPIKKYPLLALSKKLLFVCLASVIGRRASGA